VDWLIGFPGTSRPTTSSTSRKPPASDGDRYGLEKIRRILEYLAVRTLADGIWRSSGLRRTARRRQDSLGKSIAKR
jgi:hypothetical protein